MNYSNLGFSSILSEMQSGLDKQAVSLGLINKAPSKKKTKLVCKSTFEDKTGSTLNG